MKFKSILFVAVTLLITSCQSEKSKSKDKIDEPVIIEDNAEGKSLDNFVDELLDYRELNKNFAENLTVRGFGMKKFNDSIYAYVLKLDNLTTSDIVSSYSFGFKSFHQGSDSPLNVTFSPNIELKNGDKFLIMKRKLNVKSFDSLDAYIYARNNWEASGRIGGFKIIDVYFEN